MNLTNFLKQVDDLASSYSKEQLVSFIHEVGRTMPEKDRKDFLEKLISTTNDKDGIVDKKRVNKDDLYQKVIDNLDMIDNQDVSLIGILNEEYDDWYNSDADEILYQDDEGIGDIIDEASRFLHKCVDEENYEQGYDVGNRLFLLEILSVNEEYDDELLSLDDMAHSKLIKCDLKQVLLDTLFCTYFVVPISERSEALLDIIIESKMGDVTIEKIMQYGDSDLPDFNDFLVNWANYLGNRTGNVVDKLYSEAVLLFDDLSVECQYAEKYVSTHPGTYLEIMKSIKSNDKESVIDIGQKAINVIPNKYIMRSKVALEMLKSVSKSAKHQDLIEWCYFVAYESDTTPINYLNVLINGYAGRKEVLRGVFMGLSSSNNKPYSKSEREENVPSVNMLWVLKFLDGQLEEVLIKGMNVKTALGWSSTFMKQGIALYLLLMNDGDWNGKGIKAMESIARGEFGYFLDGKDFYNIFSEWKSTVVLEEDIKQKAIKTIEKSIEMRTEGIMNANRRNYYGECAAFIAAIGEVRESWGETGAKQRLMNEYKDKYSRRSAFRQEMKSFGWRG